MIKGSDLTTARTLGSRYDMDSIEIMDIDGKCYRIKTYEILKALKNLNFESKKEKVHTYLTLA